MMNIQYRELEKKDAKSLMNLRLSVLRSDPYSFSVSEDEENQSDERLVEKAIDSYSNSSDNLMLGAWKDCELVGVIGIERFGNRTESHKVRLWGPYVEETFRSNGIGSNLIQRATDFSFSINGVELIAFNTSSESKSAISLFKKYGFHETGKQTRALKFDGKYADLLYLQMIKST